MSSIWKSVAVFACAFVFALASGPGASAQIPEASYLTVDEPLDVGGTVLEPGNYIIQVLPSMSNRNILQIMSEDRTQVFATVLSVPHPLAASQEMKATKFVFYPASGDSPRALRTWYAPESTSGGGHDIVYPERRAMQIAAVAKEPVVAYRGEKMSTGLEHAQIEVVTPEQKVAEYVDRNPVQSASQSDPATGEERELPRTAGNGPLVALLGLISLGGAFLIRTLRAS